MENCGENRREPEPGAAIARLPTAPRELPHVDVARAGQVTDRNVLTLPAWFPAAKAGAVLRLKGKSFALVGDARGAQAVAHADDLAAAQPERALGGCVSPLGPAISETTPLDEALRVMDRHAASYVPVVLGCVLVGVLSRARALEALATTDPSPQRPAAASTATIRTTRRAATASWARTPASRGSSRCS